MSSIYFLFPTLLVIFISLLLVRASAIALMMTGLDEKRARFQALSAFSGTGFTTKEAESVVNHPLRRQIITWIMVFGNAGIVTVIVTTTSSFVTSRGHARSLNILFLLLGIILIYKIATHKRLMRKWENFIENKFIKSHVFEEDVVEDLLHLIEDYGLIRVIIKDNSPLIGSSILEHRLPDKGLLVLGIERNKNWLPIPKAQENIHEGDKLVVYGSLSMLRKLFKEK
ncbi:MAG: TrkA C-terminal domain-containing protein [Thermodesulfobacteriota bacterium]|nr:TrkA C-terminal domain-containing protein [Thermodesulfobacteriota bacterium]